MLAYPLQEICPYHRIYIKLTKELATTTISRQSNKYPISKPQKHNNLQKWTCIPGPLSKTKITKTARFGKSASIVHLCEESIISLQTWKYAKASQIFRGPKAEDLQRPKHSFHRLRVRQSAPLLEELNYSKASFGGPETGEERVQTKQPPRTAAWASISRSPWINNL